MAKFLVTTDKARVEAERKGSRVFMVDGTVPGWSPQSGDAHWDHHRAGGGRVQLDEMQDVANVLCKDNLVVTTQLDADAAVAAAWLCLGGEAGGSVSPEDFNRLWAIAHDCDHLYVPDSHSGLASFAAMAVADLKAHGFGLAGELGLPKNRKEWTGEDKERYASIGFERATFWLVDAVLGDRPWPGDSPEAQEYWGKVEGFTRQLVQEERLSLYGKTGLGWSYDLRGINDYVDPRAANRAIASTGVTAQTPVVLKIGDHRSVPGGIGYTLGSDPAHPKAHRLDYSRSETWYRLNLHEAKARGLELSLVAKHWDHKAQKDLPSFSEALGFSPWGGRDKVGGSGWNTASQLSPDDVMRTATTDWWR